MPNSSADLWRLKSEWQEGYGLGATDELITLCERLLRERNAHARDLSDARRLLAAYRSRELPGEPERTEGMFRDLDNLRAELHERCEMMARMATGGPCWLAVFLDDHPGAVSAIHFSADAELIYGLACEGLTKQTTGEIDP